ncbi:MAG: hypothetical protein E7594_07440 [Ruminococcaceae bacterium]|nr:hypothetical protein [Oscillospiraceae bacterium]
MAQNIKYYLGIDGGGTKTELCLADKDGTILSSALFGASNPNDIGLDATCALLSEGIDKVTDGYDRADISVFAGIAGAATGDHAARIADFLRSLGFAKADAASDVRSCLAACLGDADGISVIMGTGSVAYAQCDGQLLRAGGYGYLLCDAGSGFALGQGAILAALQAEDGSGAPTLLRDMVADACGKSHVLDALSDFYRGGKAEIARYAPLIFDAHEKGDAVATEILVRNVHAVANLIRAIGARMGKDHVRAVLCGGLTAKSEVILPILRDALASDARTYSLSVSEAAPVQGALYLAGKL